MLEDLIHSESVEMLVARSALVERPLPLQLTSLGFFTSGCLILSLSTSWLGSRSDISFLSSMQVTPAERCEEALVPFKQRRSLLVIICHQLVTKLREALVYFADHDMTQITRTNLKAICSFLIFPEWLWWYRDQILLPWVIIT